VGYERARIDAGLRLNHQRLRAASDRRGSRTPLTRACAEKQLRDRRAGRELPEKPESYISLTKSENRHMVSLGWKGIGPWREGTAAMRRRKDRGEEKKAFESLVTL
jgi:hypothetical protein